MSFSEFDGLFGTISGSKNEKKFEYKLLRSDTGEIITGHATKEQIEGLRARGYQIFVDGKDYESSQTGSGIGKTLGGLMDKLSKDINPKKGKDMNGNGWNQEDGQETTEEGTDRDMKQEMADATKNALVAVTSGSKDVLVSTAQNTWQAVVHAAAATAGFCVIAGTAFIAKKTVQMLPGAAGGVKKIIAQITANMQEQVKLIADGISESVDETSSVGKAAEEAAEAAEEGLEDLEEAIEAELEEDRA